ncbi:recombinase family protein [Streptomyces wedmorensis]|uniref:recombinase family protein n=1 Tax=Streptomyces wedmorensis TaxID=43759 RepID=UPI003437C343
MIKARAAGRSWRGIAGDLNRRGVATARGGRWSEQGVKGSVANPAWWGGRILNGALVKDPATGEPVIGTWDHADEARDGVGYETWIAIMDGVRAARFRRGVNRPGESSPGAAAPPRTYLFSGVLRCGRLNDLGEICRSRLCGNRATGRNAKYGDYYRCGDPNCKGVGRRVAAVDEFLEGLVLDHLDEHFAVGRPEPVEWRGEGKPAGLRQARHDVEASITAGAASWGDVGGLLLRWGRNIESLEGERREHSESRRKDLRGWRREKWGGMTVREKREVIARVLRSVLVLPVPDGASDKAPFDPDLLRPSWCRDAPSASRAFRGGHRPVPCPGPE